MSFDTDPFWDAIAQAKQDLEAAGIDVDSIAIVTLARLPDGKAISGVNGIGDPQTVVDLLEAGAVKYRREMIDE